MKSIDYTKMKPSKKQRLVKCPECGRVGLQRKYTDGSSCYTHSGHIELGFFNVDKFCYLRG